MAASVRGRGTRMSAKDGKIGPQMCKNTAVRTEGNSWRACSAEAAQQSLLTIISIFSHILLKSHDDIISIHPLR